MKSQKIKAYIEMPRFEGGILFWFLEIYTYTFI